MLTVKGTYKDGRVELSEIPEKIKESQVLVIFLEPHAALRVNETQAADLRARLKTFAEDWERPENSVYDEMTQLQALEALQKHLKMDEAKAAEWMASIRDARR